jgi:shikimate kinase
VTPLANLFLIGYRGTGKTTVAQLLAHRLGWDWADADMLLEARAGRNIRRLFAEDGEASFRDLEAALLAELSQSHQRVIATGGGVILRADNRQRLRSAGRTIWLTADAPTLWQRLQADAATADRRPPLTVGGLAEIEELLRLREPLYRACANMIVETAGRSPAEVVEAILPQLERLVHG